MKQFVPYQPQTANPPPDRRAVRDSLVCESCQNEIEMGAAHLVVSDCVAVPSKKDPSVSVSEYHADKAPDLIFHDRNCFVRYVLDQMFEEGDEALGDLAEYIVGGPAIPCICVNCGGDLETPPEPLCNHCEGKME